MRSVRHPTAAAALLAAFSIAACGDTAPPTSVTLDGTPRVPDGSGIVVEAGADRLELAEGTIFGYAEEFVSFATATQELVPVRGTPGDFVLYAVHDDELRWLGVVSAVVTVDGERRAYHGGRFVERDEEQRLVFADGTVLPAAPGLEDPPTGRVSTVTIDPERGLVIGVV